MRLTLSVIVAGLSLSLMHPARCQPTSTPDPKAVQAMRTLMREEAVGFARGRTSAGTQVAGDPSVATTVPPVVTPPDFGVPAPAAAVGYNKRTLGPKVLMGQNWFKSDNGTNVTTNSDGSVTLAGQSNNYNYGILSGDGHSYGTAFGGGGYFEIDCSWTGNYDSSHGWPSLWANAVESRTIAAGPNWPAAVNAGGGGNAVEWDILETFSDGWGLTLWEWATGGNIGTRWTSFNAVWNVAQGGV